MKKSILLILTLTFCLAFAKAQITIMPYGRMDFSNNINHQMHPIMDCDTDFELDIYKFSTTVGIDVNYIFTRNWSLKTGIMYQEMGNRQIGGMTRSSNNRLVNINREVAIHYLNLPLQIQYNFRPQKTFSPYIAVGSIFHLNTSNSLKTIRYDEHSMPYLLSETSSLRSNVDNYTARKYNVSIKADIGLNYQLTSKLFLQNFLSANFLLLPTIDDTNSEIKHYNIGLGLGLGYSI